MCKRCRKIEVYGAYKYQACHLIVFFTYLLTHMCGMFFNFAAHVFNVRLYTVMQVKSSSLHT